MITFEAVKEMFKKSIDATDTMNQALEHLMKSIYLKGYNEALEQQPIAEERYQDLVEYFGDKDIAKCILEDREEFKKWLKELKQLRKQTKWIPVSERLPESSGVYIVTREFTDGFECADLTDACYFDGTSTWHDDNRINHGREYVDKKIKAWMPLPEPYKAESEE